MRKFRLRYLQQGLRQVATGNRKCICVKGLQAVEHAAASVAAVACGRQGATQVANPQLQLQPQHDGLVVRCSWSAWLLMVPVVLIILATGKPYSGGAKVVSICMALLPLVGLCAPAPAPPTPPQQRTSSRSPQPSPYFPVHNLVSMRGDARYAGAAAGATCRGEPCTVSTRTNGTVITLVALLTFWEGPLQGAYASTCLASGAPTVCTYLTDLDLSAP